LVKKYVDRLLSNESVPDVWPGLITRVPKLLRSIEKRKTSLWAWCPNSWEPNPTSLVEDIKTAAEKQLKHYYLHTDHTACTPHQDSWRQAACIYIGISAIYNPGGTSQGELVVGIRIYCLALWLRFALPLVGSS